jgi:lipoate---protein ligase
VGAVSRRGVLRLPASSSHLFDVEQFRAEPKRVVVARDVSGPTLVLGSTQPTELVGVAAMHAGAVELVRRRGGGGAVYLEPGGQLWLDAWIPRADPLWIADVSVAAEWVGSWWSQALAGGGQHPLDVHRGRSEPGELGTLVCFAGRGPGEVFDGGRKVVGLSQWRAREGALFSSCAYRHWDPTALLAVMEVDETGRAGLARDLAPLAVGLGDLDPPVTDLEGVRTALLGSFPSFGTPSGGGSGSV